MEMLAAFVFMSCSLLVNSEEGDTVVRMEPDYNPMWVQMGQRFSATCIAESAQAQPVSWTVNGGLPEMSGFTVKNSTTTLPDGRVRTSSLLTKESMSFDDIGIDGLLCRAKDSHEIYVAAHFFNVLTEHPNITEGEDISLKCAPDVPSHVIWSRDGARIDNSTERRIIQDGNKTLVIQNSRPQDSGMYECKVLIEGGFDATTKKPKLQAFIQNIPVSAKPYLLEKVTSRVETLINDTLSLSCPVAAYPPPDVFWLRDDDSPVHKSARVHLAQHRGIDDASLTVTNVTKSDLGVYVCVAENSVGRMVKQFNVGLVGGASFDRAHAGMWSVLIGLCVAVLFSMSD